MENLAPTGIRSPDRVARTESLYRLSHPGPRLMNVDIENDPIKLSQCTFYEYFIIVIGREWIVDSVLQMEVQLLLELCPKVLTTYISGTCAHGRAVDYIIYSITNTDAFPSVECLNLDEALSGACTDTATAFMGDDIRFE